MLTLVRVGLLCLMLEQAFCVPDCCGLPLRQEVCAPGYFVPPGRQIGCGVWEAIGPADLAKMEKQTSRKM